MKSELTPAQKKLVSKQIKRGGYANATEVVSDALRLLEMRNRAQEDELKEFYASIRRGREDLRSGRWVHAADLTVEQMERAAAERSGARKRRKSA